MTDVTAPARTDATPAAGRAGAARPAQRGQAHARPGPARPHPGPRHLPVHGRRRHGAGRHRGRLLRGQGRVVGLAAGRRGRRHLHPHPSSPSPSPWPPPRPCGRCRSMRANDQRNVGIALLFTAFLGLATANAEWAAFDKAGFGVGDHAYGTFYFLLIGFHLVHLVAAVGLIAAPGRAVAGRALLGRPPRSPAQRRPVLPVHQRRLVHGVHRPVRDEPGARLMAKSAVLTQPSRIFLPVSVAGLAAGRRLRRLHRRLAGHHPLPAAARSSPASPGWSWPASGSTTPPSGWPPTPTRRRTTRCARAPLPAGGAWPFTAALAVTLILLGFVVGPAGRLLRHRRGPGHRRRLAGPGVGRHHRPGDQPPAGGAARPRACSASRP